jgi:Cu2+-exporting ATPase
MEPSPGRCEHCGAPSAARFCCSGCAHVAELRTELASPEGEAAWIDCDLQGLHCSACVSLIEATFRTQTGAKEITINPALGRAALLVVPGFDLSGFAAALAPLGYRIGSAKKAETAGTQSLLLRLGICAALAMNSMAFSFAIYFGLSAKEGALFFAFGWINFALALASLAIGGTFFLANAWRAIRARTWHIDIPLALSVILAFFGATWVFFASGQGATYFDTFTAFIALMLVGKYAPARLVERNRATLLEDDGLSSLPQTRVQSGGFQRIEAGRIAVGDLLSFAPGDLVTVEVELRDNDALCSLDWINGEPAAVSFSRGARVPAGAFNAGYSAFTGVAASTLADSALARLLNKQSTEAKADQSLAAFSRLFVIAALALGVLTFFAWSFVDVERGVWAAISVLIVACPCAIGLGTPLAREMALRRLRRAGIFVRRDGTLDRLATVDSVVFDKTGTLTELQLSEASRVSLEALEPMQRVILNALINRSNHPVARCLRSGLRPTLPLACVVREAPGVGLEATFGDEVYTLGRAAEGDSATTFSVFRDGMRQVLATILVEEALRDDAPREVERLRNAGYSLAILSGDVQARVDGIAGRLALDRTRCVGMLSAADKAAWVRAHAEEHTLLLGDGVNDVQAIDAATCSGTPAIDRPFVPARADFYYRSNGIGSVREALSASKAYVAAKRFNYGFAAIYNLVMLSVAANGTMSPLIAAIVMPVSSIAIVLCNALIVRGRA